MKSDAAFTTAPARDTNPRAERTQGGAGETRARGDGHETPSRDTAAGAHGPNPPVARTKTPGGVGSTRSAHIKSRAAYIKAAAVVNAARAACSFARTVDTAASTVVSTIGGPLFPADAGVRAARALWFAAPAGVFPTPAVLSSASAVVSAAPPSRLIAACGFLCAGLYV
jgi:hypothetical protein